MANHKRTAADGEFQLPQEIIHRVQSCMDEREAARTCILSKSWYGAWSTRSTLNFVQSEFRRRSSDVFSEFTKKTMQRYEDLNLKIETFMLRMEDNHSLATELILKAIKLGAVYLEIEIIKSFVLPDEVLESETLTRLSINGFEVDLESRKKEVTCSNLKSLTLINVTVKGDLFRDLISRCPLIEELGLDTLTMSFSGEDKRMHEFDKLKYLFLGCLDAKETLCRATFHCLKYLVIRDDYYGWNNVRICSPSLESITIYLLHNKIMNAEFDVPNITKFEFHGSPLSGLKFKSTTCREWESDIRIRCSRSQPSDEWFSSLNKLVKMLSLSRVSLSIDVRICLNEYRYVGDGLPLSEVENLTLEGYAPNYPAFLYNLFFICCPKLLIITEDCVGRQLIKEYLFEIVCKKLVEEVRVVRLILL